MNIMAENKKIRLIDVAREVKVSHAAVASVLTGGSTGTRVSQETAAKIREAAKRMNYQPNLHARVLRGGASKVVGIVSFGLDSYLFNAVTESFNKTMLCWEYQSIIAVAPTFDSAGLWKVLENLRAFAVDGLAVMSYPANVDWAEFTQALNSWRGPLVLIDSQVENFSSVNIDRAGGMEKMIHFLHSHGKRELVFLRSLPNFALDKLHGLEKAIAELQIPWSSDRIYNLMDDNSGYAGVVEKILSLKKRPDCIICAGDTTAFGVINELLKRGIRIPEDIGVTGFDDNPLLKFCPVAVTTVRHPGYDTGVSAANFLLQAIQHPEQPEVRKNLLSPELIIRNSV